MSSINFNSASFLKRIWLIVFVVFVFASLSSTLVSVQYGTVAVVTRFGQVTDRVLQPGLNFKIPFVERTVVYRTQKVVYETSDNPQSSQAAYTDYPVDTTTKDGQVIGVRYSVRFSIDPKQAAWIANNLGTEEDVVYKIVQTDSRIHTRNIPKEFNAADLYTGNIQDVQQKIDDELRPIFEQNGLILDEFGIRNISFSEEYVQAVEAKQIAKEVVTTEQYIAEQEQYKKEAAITKAEGEAQAQRLQQQTLSNELLSKLWIEKWDGRLPTYMGQGTPLIQFPK
ncbi:prohibitin family protein [Candidatus Dojkabacteria bacterium]|nr:prohibitin family protein [Candidatus Dojkabacteria bacterium]